MVMFAYSKIVATRLKNIFFHKQSFLLIPVILFLWYSLDALYSYNITAEKLRRFSGTVVFLDSTSIPVSRNMNRGAKGHYLRLKLNSEFFPFFIIRTVPNSRMDRLLTSRLKLGNDVILYTEPQFLDGVIQRSGSNTVVKLVRGNTVIFDYFHISNKVSYKMALISIPLFIVSLALYLVKTRQRLLKNVD